MLERLRSADEQPVTLEHLRAGGIDFPAVVMGELELNGYVIERVYEHGRQIGVRLLETERPRSTRLTPAPAMASSFAIATCRFPLHVSGIPRFGVSDLLAWMSVIAL
jgi:hypothetical protein